MVEEPTPPDEPPPPQEPIPPEEPLPPSEPIPPTGPTPGEESAPELVLIGPDQPAFRLELTAAQMKIVHTALKSLFDDLGREEHDVKDVVASVLAKLPGEHDIRAIDLDRELHGR
jgi:hypothetical protein